MCPAQVYEVGRAGRRQGRGDRDAVELRPVRRDHGQGRPADAGRGRRRPRVLADVISHDDVLAAREAIGGRLHRTPLFSSRALSERIGAEAYLKAELFQRTGSFKPRGMLAKLASLSAEEKARGIVTWSAGQRRRRAPRSRRASSGSPAASSCGGRRTRSRSPPAAAYGAEVDLESEGPAEAHERLLAFVEETGRDVRPSVRRSRAPGRLRGARARDRRGRARRRRRSSSRSAAAG